jgi:hypothetical protein
LRCSINEFVSSMDMRGKIKHQLPGQVQGFDGDTGRSERVRTVSPFVVPQPLGRGLVLPSQPRHATPESPRPRQAFSVPADFLDKRVVRCTKSGTSCAALTPQPPPKAMSRTPAAGLNLIARWRTTVGQPVGALKWVGMVVSGRLAWSAGSNLRRWVDGLVFTR